MSHANRKIFIRTVFTQVFIFSNNRFKHTDSKNVSNNISLGGHNIILIRQGKAAFPTSVLDVYWGFINLRSQD